MESESGWAEVEVFADHLQARGDPRGELLALELAAERATDSHEARRLNREAQRVRASCPDLVWPRALRDSCRLMRAGFVIVGNLEVPLELLLSARHFNVAHNRRLEDCVPLLARARARGLRLESLSKSSIERVAGPPTDLSGLRRLSVIEADGPVLERLSIEGAVVDPAALATLTGLRECKFGAPLSQAELCSLAPLQLEHLRLHGPTVDPVIVPLFGNTLASLELHSFAGSLAPLAELPWLRRLRLNEGPSRETAAGLAALFRLERLEIEELHTPELIELLRSLPLRHLSIDSLRPELIDALAGACRLESLCFSVEFDDGIGTLDISALADMPTLRSLVLPGDIVGHLRLPANLQTLAIHSLRRPLAITGEVAELVLTDTALRCIPADVLAEVRDLTFMWWEDSYDECLAELPRACPRLESLSVFSDTEQGRRLAELPTILDRLPCLRRFQVLDATVGELAELTRAFPHLCPFESNSGSPSHWPRSAGGLPRASVVVGATTRPSSAEPASELERLRRWAADAKADGDRRAALLELELAAELAHEPAEARAFNIEAQHLRAENPRLAWPSTLHNDRAVLRGGLPVWSTARWLEYLSPDTSLMRWLRAVEIEVNTQIDVCVANLSKPRAAQIEGLKILADNPAGGFDFGSLAALEQLERLELCRDQPRQALRRLPELGLRHLTLTASNHELDPGIVARFASTLESLHLLGAPSNGALEPLELPRLERLRLGHGWDLGGLCGPAFVDLADAQLDHLVGLGLNEPSVTVHHILREPVEWPCDSYPPPLRSFGLTWLGEAFDRVARALPERPEPLRMTIGCGSKRVGSIGTLVCDALTLEHVPEALGAEVWGLTWTGSSLARHDIARRFPRLEEIVVYELDLLGAQLLVDELRRLPRLRRVNFMSLTVGEIMKISAELPEVAMQGGYTGWRDPNFWPAGC